MKVRDRRRFAQPLSRLALPVALTVLLTASPARAQSRQTENTLRLDAGAVPGLASIADAAWLEGHWRGEAMGGTAEELWLPAAGGAMLGMFRLATPDSPRFYELFSVSAVDGSLVIRLKHFNADMTGWEEKAETVDFPLVRAGPDALYFSGLTYRRVSDDELHSFVAARGPDGSTSELVFRFRRVR